MIDVYEERIKLAQKEAFIMRGVDYGSNTTHALIPEKVMWLFHFSGSLNSRTDGQIHPRKQIWEGYYLLPTISIVIKHTKLNQVTKLLMVWQIDMPSSSSLLCEFKTVATVYWVKRYTLRDEIPSDIHASALIIINTRSNMQVRDP